MVVAGEKETRTRHLSEWPQSFAVKTVRTGCFTEEKVRFNFQLQPVHPPPKLKSYEFTTLSSRQRWCSQVWVVLVAGCDEMLHLG